MKVSVRRIRSSEITLKTGDPVLTGRFARGWRYSWNSRLPQRYLDERIRRTLTFMGRPADTQITPDLAREICERTGSAAVLEKARCKPRSPVRLGITRQELRRGDILDDQQAQAARKEEC